MAKQRLPADKELVIGGGATDGKLALSIKNGECTKFTGLQYCDHEEADTRMLLHAKHASRDAQRVVIPYPDTDVLWSVSPTMTRSNVTSCGFELG